MSTKSTLRLRPRTPDQPGYVLYDDVLDAFGAVDGPEPPVYLQIDGVVVSLETLRDGGASVTLTLPRELARELGLLPKKV